MKAKDLAELLLQHPEFDVSVKVCTSMPTYDEPYGKYEVYSIDDIEYVDCSYNNIVLGSL